MKRLCAVLTLTALLLSVCAAGAAEAASPAERSGAAGTSSVLCVPTGDIRGSFTASSGSCMEYYMYAPDNAVRGMPLVVFLHGDGLVGLPDDLKDCGIVTRAKEIYGADMPFILLLPSTSVPSWTDYGIPYTLRELIDSVAAEYSCDMRRISVTGHSRGATGVWTMVTLNPNYFSAAAPVSCPSVGFWPESFRHTPLKALVGDAYNDYGYYGRDMENHVYALRLAGASASLTVIENCSHGEASVLAYTRELLDWLTMLRRSIRTHPERHDLPM